MAQIVDYYSESNAESTGAIICTGSVTKRSQSFTGNGGTLNKATLYIKKLGSPTGNITVNIYDITGTFGTDAKPTGSALATSTFDISTLTTSFQLIDFTFSGVNKITLTNGVNYCVSIEYGGGKIDVDELLLGIDNSSPTHNGNPAYYYGGWNGYNTLDTCFYVYKDDPPSIALTGTAIASITEADIVTGGKTIILTIIGDTWVATVGEDNAVTDALIAGIDSAQSEATGWDAVVKANMVYTDVVRTSDTVVTITLGAEATYDITAQETITATIPASALTGVSQIVASPTFTVSVVGGTVVKDIISPGIVAFPR